MENYGRDNADLAALLLLASNIQYPREPNHLFNIS